MNKKYKKKRSPGIQIDFREKHSIKYKQIRDALMIHCTHREAMRSLKIPVPKWLDTTIAILEKVKPWEYYEE